MAVVITGTEKVIANLNREVLGIKNRTRGGLRLAVLIWRREATPITPLEFGNLRGSYYTEVFDTTHGPVGEIGLTAEYAPYVHEMDDNVNWTTPGTGNKFLTKAAAIARREMLEAIRSSGAIKNVPSVGGAAKAVTSPAPRLRDARGRFISTK